MKMQTKLKRPRFKMLLAKSVDRPWKGAYTLVGHTAAVVRATTTLVDALGDRLIHQFNLQASFSELRATVRMAAFLHDLGKANHHFQLVVYKKRNPLQTPQLIRHEIASIMLAWELRDWLAQCEGDWFTALIAAGGHHLKLGGKAGARTDELGEVRKETGDNCLYLYTDHPHFKALLRYGCQTLNGLPEQFPDSLPTCWKLGELKQRREAILSDFPTFNLDPVFSAIVKSLLVAGDAVGSALPPKNINIESWIQGEIQHTLSQADLQKVIDARLQKNQLLPFQKQLGESQYRVTLAQAGCGTGKTVGAYNWAKKHALGKKLFFCYPTTGTSTEGFLDYVHDRIDSVLFHSRSDVDLAMAKTGEEEEAGDGTENEPAKKLESFKAWGQQAIVCTVDTVLGLLQCNRRPMYSFPAIANAAFVFDEVHCYDDPLFGALLRFLETVKAPILLMSASFLPWQLDEIEKAVGEKLEIVPGDPKLEQLPRYRFHLAEAPNWQRVEREFATGGKILWVCNQVNTAIEIYQQAKERGLNPLLYHSRYRYEDRVQHHREVIDAFQLNPLKMKLFLYWVSRLQFTDESALDGFITILAGCNAVLAIATQVAEMSLDLSATLLVSQIADPAGLIQRLGRLNRRYCGDARDAIFYPDTKVGYPYSKQDLDAGQALIESFCDRVCQAELAQWLKQADFRGNPERDCVLLDGKWRTYPAPLRKEGHTLTVLLQQDLPHVKSLKPNQLPRYTVPILIPKGNDNKNQQWDRHKGYPVAPADEWGYSAEVGAYELNRR